MVQPNFRNRKSLFLCKWVSAFVCAPGLERVAAEHSQKEDDGCETNMLLQKPEVCLLPIFSTTKFE